MKVWNKRDPNCPPDAVYVGRPSKWGNPFIIGKKYETETSVFINASRREVLGLYKSYLRKMIKSGQLDLSELKGKDLICWCAPKPCHADVLMELANKSISK